MEMLITPKGGIIEADFEAAKAYLKEQLNAYDTVVFTEDTKKDAKDTVAQLRKDKKALQDRIKEVKAEYMKPYEDFYAKASELIEMYDTPINHINGMIEVFEAKRIEEKRKAIEEYYNEIIPEQEWREVLPFEKIYNKKWENATTTTKAIKEEMMEYKTNAKAAYDTIKSLKSDKEEQALKMYNENLDLQPVLKFLADYEAHKREVLEAKREKVQRETEERIRAEERAKIEAEQQKQAEIEKATSEGQQMAIDQFIPEVNEDEVLEECTYLIRLTKDAKEKLEMFMNSIGIEFFEC